MRRALGVAAALALCACAALTPSREPPAARAPVPAPGYHAKTPQGVDLVYDAARGVYAVTGAPDSYWVDQRFYRRAGTGWVVAPALEGPWTACASGELPPGLRSEEGR